MATDFGTGQLILADAFGNADRFFWDLSLTSGGAVLTAAQALDLDPMTEYWVNWSYLPTGSPSWGAPNQFTLYFRDRTGNTDIQTRQISLSGSRATQTGSFKFSPRSSGLNVTPSGTPYYGGFIIDAALRRTTAVAWGDYNSDGTTGTAAVGVTSTTRDRNAVRSPIQIGSVDISNVSLGGATPSLWAYPDPIYIRWNFLQSTARLHENTNVRTETYHDDAPLTDIGQTSFVLQSSSNAYISSDMSADTYKIDKEYSGHSDPDYAARIMVTPASVSDIAGSSQPAYVFSATRGLAATDPTNWKIGSGFGLGTGSKEFGCATGASVITADPTTLGDQFTIGDGVVGSVFHRREIITGSFRLRNARLEGLQTVPGGHIVEFFRAEDSGLDFTATVVSSTGGIISWSYTVPTSGGPTVGTTAAGLVKHLQWRDGSSVTTEDRKSQTGAIALSSLLVISDITYDHPNDSVFNRSETQGGTFKLLTQRGTPFTRYSSESVRIMNDSTVEEFATVSHDDVTGTVTWSRKFAVSGNVAPATTAGQEKTSRWLDSSGNQALDMPRIGYLSSLVDVVDVSHAGLLTDVFNRGEVVTGLQFIVRNRRGQPFADATGVTVRVVNSANNALEQSPTNTYTAAEGKVAVALTFSASGNAAPATVDGALKRLRYAETSGNTPASDSADFGALSSLLDLVDVRTAFNDLNDTVYNRGQAATVLGALKNRRGQGFAGFVSESFTSFDFNSAANEQTMTVVTHDGPTGEFELTSAFATSGNVAPATGQGARKDIKWADSSGNTTNTAQYAFLSSLYNVNFHLQVNNPVLDPENSQLTRLTSDLGFYTLFVSDQKSLGIAGVTVNEYFTDDQDLLLPTEWPGLVTDAQGYLPMKGWADQLPSGGWDLWSDAGTHNGNVYEKVREPSGSYDFTLLAPNPNYVIIGGAGDPMAAITARHWHPGETLLIGAALYNRDTRQLVEVDDSEDNAPTVAIGRFHSATGTAQYFDGAGTWQTLLGPGQAAYEHRLVPSPGDPKVWLMQLSAEVTASFDNSGLFFAVTMKEVGTPYVTTFGVDAPGPHANHGLAYQVMTSGGPTSKPEHWSPGMAFQAGLSVIDMASAKNVPVDGFRQVALLRLQDSGPTIGYGEYLNILGQWVPLDGAEDEIHFFDCVESRPGSNVYIVQWSAEETETWGDYDIFVLGRAKVGHYEFNNYFKEIVVGNKNPHGSYKFDGAGFLGFPSK